VTIDNIIEVDETHKIIKFFAYVPKPIPIEIVSEASSIIHQFNENSEYGYAELYLVNANESSQYYIRFKVSTFLKGIKVGKVDAVEIFVNNAQSQCANLYFDLCSDLGIKEWLID